MTNCNFVWFTILLIHLAHLKDFSTNIFCLHSNFVKYNRFILLCGKSVWSFDSIVNSPHKKWLQMDNCFINLFFFWDWDAFSSSHFNSKKCFLSKKKSLSNRKNRLLSHPIVQIIASPRLSCVCTLWRGIVGWKWQTIAQKAKINISRNLSFKPQTRECFRRHLFQLFP